MKAIRYWLILFLGLMYSWTALAQLIVEEPGYQIINTFGVPAGLSSSLGTMLFSADGNTVYIIENSEDADAAISSAIVVRDGNGDVIGFGTFTQVFAHPNLDSGLEFGPGTDTYFFRVEPERIGQRLTNGSIETTIITGYDGYYGGLGFIPPGYTNGGDIVTAAYNEYYELYKHDVTPDGDGSFTVNGAGTLYADFTAADEYYVSDIVFITSGHLAGNAMVSLYYGTNSLVYFPIDADGLPVGGVSVTPQVFASGSTGAWGVAVDPVTDNIWMIDYYETGGIALTQIGYQEESQKQATFEVTKSFTDGNTGDVQVNISCNNGLPLKQSFMISSGESVTFVVTSFADGQMNCSITESPVPGYSATYNSLGSDSSGDDSDPDKPGCNFFNIVSNDENFCSVTNNPNPVEVVVNKDWFIKGAVGNEVSMKYSLTLYCDAEIVNGSPFFLSELNPGALDLIAPVNLWYITWNGDGDDSFIAEVIPEFPSSSCSVVERVFDNYVEVDNGCASLEVSVGNGANCTITNTAFFEGIPTLNQFGLALLALLMLGLGMVGLRR